MGSEELAKQLGDDPARLRAYLQEAKSLLYREFQVRFSKATFDAAGKRLVSDDGKLALQWRVRRRPGEPVAYENQQTNRGDVYLVAIE